MDRENECPKLKRRFVRVTRDDLRRRQFERMVADAVASLPLEFRGRLDNVDVIVEDEPDEETLAEAGVDPGQTLYGFYRGVPHHNRGSSYSMALPDTITIYRRPISEDCRTTGQIRNLVRGTVIHEIAHHFGISDEDLGRLGIS